MNKSRLPIFLVCALIALLSVLAFLQYRWLGQISASEREQMQRRLDADTKNFADDFNREIQGAYFNFQLKSEDWKTKNYNEFTERYKFWQENTAYKELIKDFYFVQFDEAQSVLKYDQNTKTFENAALPNELDSLKTNLTPEGILQPVAIEIPALLMPIHESETRVDKILIRTKTIEDNVRQSEPLPLPKKLGVLIVELNANVIKERILPDLNKKYFSEGTNADFNVAISNKENQTVFQTQNVSAKDLSAKLFDLSSNNFVFYANR
ncbi:MAG TPA: hypothetical protein PKY59_20445, partial [Pyrinomonadaceae bacterium]|nr:hypothetical protein [Pyrinomonadaceae bacterium]